MSNPPISNPRQWAVNKLESLESKEREDYKKQAKDTCPYGNEAEQHWYVLKQIWETFSDSKQPWRECCPYPPEFPLSDQPIESKEDNVQSGVAKTAFTEDDLINSIDSVARAYGLTFDECFDILASAREKWCK